MGNLFFPDHIQRSKKISLAIQDRASAKALGVFSLDEGCVAGYVVDLTNKVTRAYEVQTGHIERSAPDDDTDTKLMVMKLQHLLYFFYVLQRRDVLVHVQKNVLL